MRSKLIAGLLGACVVGGVWLIVSLANDDPEQSLPQKGSALTGLDSDPALVTGIHPRPGERVLARGRGWLFVITPEQELVLRQLRSAQTVRNYTRPVTLNEATAFAVRRAGVVVTLVAGPIDRQAAEVLIETRRGSRKKARVLDAYGLTWFFAEIRGKSAITAITARAVDDRVVGEFTLPPMSPNGPGVITNGIPGSPR